MHLDVVVDHLEPALDRALGSSEQRGSCSSFQRTLESIVRQGRDGDRKITMGPSVRRDDGDYSDLPLQAGLVQETDIRDANRGRIARLADPCGHGGCLLQFVNRGYDEIAT